MEKDNLVKSFQSDKTSGVVCGQVSTNFTPEAALHSTQKKAPRSVAGGFYDYFLLCDRACVFPLAEPAEVAEVVLCKEKSQKQAYGDKNLAERGHVCLIEFGSITVGRHV